MFVTIYSDASIGRKGAGKRARWAFYAKCELGVLEDCGHADRDGLDVNAAEMYAICMAIWKCYCKWPSLEGFFVNTDSMHCCYVWWPHRKDPRGDACIEMRDKLVAKLGGRWVRVKHVKGHRGGRDVRSYLNRRVDRMASQRCPKNGTKSAVE